MKFIQLKEVMSMTGKKHASIYADMKKGTFPQSVSRGGRAVAWVLAEIEQWMRERIEARKSV